MVQWVKFHSVLLLSTACSLMAGTVAAPRTWSDGLGSASEAILRSVARYCTGCSITAGTGSPSLVGSGFSSAHRGDGGLGSGLKVKLARSSLEQTINGDLFLTSIHSTKVTRSARGPSSDYGALHVGFKLEHTEHVVSVAREMGESKKQSGMVLKQFFTPAPAEGGGISGRQGDP